MNANATATVLDLTAIDAENFELCTRINPKDNIESLKKNIEKFGVQKPITVRGNSEPYQVVSGFRRLLACIDLGRDTIPALVIPEITDREALTRSIQENMTGKSSGLSTLDKAFIIEKLKTDGMPEDDIKSLLDISQRTYLRMIQTANLPEHLQESIDDESISTAQALHINSRDLTPDEKRAWVARVIEDELSFRGLQKAMNPKSDLFIKTRDHGFKLVSLKYSPEDTNPEEKESILQALYQAIEILEGDSTEEDEVPVEEAA